MRVADEKLIMNELVKFLWLQVIWVSTVWANQRAVLLSDWMASLLYLQPDLDACVLSGNEIKVNVLVNIQEEGNEKWTFCFLL